MDAVLKIVFTARRYAVGQSLSVTSNFLLGPVTTSYLVFGFQALDPIAMENLFNGVLNTWGWEKLAIFY